MKKLFALVLIFALFLSACGKTEEPVVEPNEEPSEIENSETEEISEEFVEEIILNFGAVKKEDAAFPVGQDFPCESTGLFPINENDFLWGDIGAGSHPVNQMVFLWRMKILQDTWSAGHNDDLTVGNALFLGTIGLMEQPHRKIGGGLIIRIGSDGVRLVKHDYVKTVPKVCGRVVPHKLLSMVGFDGGIGAWDIALVDCGSAGAKRIIAAVNCAHMIHCVLEVIKIIVGK
jgi:hypothetical protein